MSESGFHVAPYSVWGVGLPTTLGELPPTLGASADARSYGGRDGVTGWLDGM